MTANQRRPGFRLPWSSETEGAMMDGEEAAEPAAADDTSASLSDAVAGEETPKPESAQPKSDSASTLTVPAEHDAPKATDAAPTEAAAPEVTPADAAVTAAAAAAAAGAEGGDEFMHELVVAMRRVADEARESGMTDLMTRADAQVQTLEADADKRRADLRAAADADVAGIGEWSTTEAERIKREAEQKVIARKARLDQELAADAARTDTETKAVRSRVADYERELEAYHGQLAEINDPAAFAAAAKRLPKAPVLGGSAVAAAGALGAADAPPDAGSNGTAPADTGPEALAVRLAELDASLDNGTDEPAAAVAEVAAPVEDSPAAATEAVAPEAAPESEPEASAEAEPAPAAEAAADEHASETAPTEAPDPEPSAAVASDTVQAPASAPVSAGDPVVTEVVVKGLGSFGAITGFRQSLSSVDGIDSVALSLGQTGEFVFRATHGTGFDVRGAIASLEGEGAKIENRPEGGLRVTLERAR